MSPREPLPADEDEAFEAPKRRRKTTSGKSPNNRATSSRLKPVDPGKADARRATATRRAPGTRRKVKQEPVDEPGLGWVLLGGIIRVIGLVVLGLARLLQLV